MISFIMLMRWLSESPRFPKNVRERCESWTIKKAKCQRIDAANCVAREDFESLLDSKEIKPVNSKGNQPWIFPGRSEDESETSILWPSDGKSWLIGKCPDAGKDRGQEEEGTENETVGWHHQLNGHEFQQILVDSEGQESLACCSSWGLKELDTT